MSKSKKPAVIMANKPVTTAILLQRGLTAFQERNYREAVNLWQLARQQADAPATLPAALAEAHFRLALLSPIPLLDHLQQAVQLNPTAPVYRYHVALTYHRQQKFTEAEPIYRQLLSESPPYTRAALPLGQLLVEQKQPLVKDPVWKLLTLTEQVSLSAAEALIKDKALSTLQKILDMPQLDPIWGGLVAFYLKQFERASAQFALGVSAANQAVQAMLHYYAGLTVVQHGDFDKAVISWELAQAMRIKSRLFQANLGSLYFQKAQQAYQAGQFIEAASLFNQIKDETYIVGYREIKPALFWSAGNALAQQNNWPQALEYWQIVATMGDDDRRLLFNLALAHQKLQHHGEAANLWREVLRRRPRKADHADALSEEQVARIWQNAAEGYSHAGNYEEAIKTYKNAIKWKPDSLDLRLKLVEAYQTEGRWLASSNELKRILEEHPNHVPALLLMAEVKNTGSIFDMAEAIELWQRALELEPQNPVAKSQLGRAYGQKGQLSLSWGDLSGALEAFREGLIYQPDSPDLHVGIAIAYAQSKQFDQAKATFEQVLSFAPTNLNVWLNIYITWLHHKRVTDLQQVIAQIKALEGVPGAFFVELVKRAMAYQQVAVAEEWLQFMEVRFADDEANLILLAMCYGDLRRDAQSVALLRRVLERNPQNGEANMRLGGAYYEMKQTRLAKRHWDMAEAQAKQDNNQMLLYELRTMRDFYIRGRKSPQNMLDFITQMPPEALDELLKTAPPQIAQMLRNADPETLRQFLSMSGLLDE